MSEHVTWKLISLPTYGHYLVGYAFFFASFFLLAIFLCLELDVTFFISKLPISYHPQLNSLAIHILCSLSLSPSLCFGYDSWYCHAYFFSIQSLTSIFGQKQRRAKSRAHSCFSTENAYTEWCLKYAAIKKPCSTFCSMCLSNEAKPSIQSFNNSFISFVVLSCNFVIPKSMEKTAFAMPFEWWVVDAVVVVVGGGGGVVLNAQCSMSRYHLMRYRFVVQMITPISLSACLFVCLFVNGHLFALLCAVDLYAFVFHALSRFFPLLSLMHLLLFRYLQLCWAPININIKLACPILPPFFAIYSISTHLVLCKLCTLSRSLTHFSLSTHHFAFI